MSVLDGWKYKQAITISNPNNASFTDFQVKIELDENWPGWGQAQPDLSDIRFSDEGGTKVYPHYIDQLGRLVHNTIIPRGDQTEGVIWKYTTTTPPDDSWTTLDFDDSSWETGESPIGDTGPKRTTLDFTDIYLRKKVTLPSGAKVVWATLRIASDDGADAWVNGTQVLNDSASGHGYHYWDYSLNVTSLLNGGDNIIAIHVHDSGGSNYFDAELEIWYIDPSQHYAVIYVKVPQLPSGGAGISMWWGNPSATNESNPNAVFDFYEDFNGAELPDGWDATNITVFGVADSWVHIKSNSGRKNLIYSQLELQRGVVVEAMGYSTGANPTIGVAWGTNDLSSGYTGMAEYVSPPSMTIMVGTTRKAQDASIASPTAPTYIALAVGESTVTVIERELDGSEHTYSLTDTTYSSGHVGVTAAWTDKDNWYDWVRVRKYAETEPTVTLGDIIFWPLSSWKSRNKLTVSNSTTSELTNFQVKIELDDTWAGWGLVKSDGSDIRVTDADGNLIPHYIESFDATNKTAVIWVKVPSIPAGVDDGSGNITPGTADIYIYYNNPDATDASDPASVFDFYDDFSTLDDTVWANASLKIADRNTDVSFTFGTDLYVENSELVMKKSLNAGECANIAIQNFELAEGQLVEAKGRAVSGKDWALTLAVGSADNSAFIFFSAYNNTLNIEYEVGGSKTHVTDAGATLGANYTFGIVRLSDKLHLYALDENGTSVLSGDASTTFSTNNIFLSQSSYTADTPEARVDWVRVRKYAETEPTFTIASREDLVKYYTFAKRVKLQLTADADNEDVELIIDDKFKGFWAHRGVELAVAKDGETVRYPYTINSETTDHISIVVKGVTGTPNDVFWLYFDDGQDRDTSNLDDTFTPANLDKKFKLLYETADPYIIYDVTLTGFGGKLKESDLTNLTVVDGNTGTVVAHKVVSYETDDSGAVTSLRLQVRAAYATDTRTFYLYLVSKGQTFDTPDTYIYPIASAGWSLLWEQKSVGVSTSILLDGNSFNVTEYDVGYRRNAYHFDIEEGESYNLPSSNYSRVFRLRLVATDDELATLHTIMKRPYILVDWLGEEFYGQIIELRYRKDARRPMVYDVELTVERVRVV